MSELPAAEAAIDADGGLDPNERAGRGQTLKWSLAILFLGVAFILFVLSQLSSGAKRVSNTDDPKRILATADNAAANLSPEAQLAELQAQNQGLTTQLQRMQGENVHLQTQLTSTTADAERTINALDTAVSTRAAAAPGPVGYPSAYASGGAASPVQGGAASPTPMPYSVGPNPFSGSGGGMGATAAPSDAPDAAPPPRPRRTMGVVRAARGGGGVQRVANAGAPGAADHTGTNTPNAGDQQGYVDGAKQGPAGGGSYFSGSLQTFESGRYVPPNAYARAKVLVGVDAAAGVSSGADPKPVLFRLTGPAVHVGSDGKFQTTDLRGCQVNGAAYGELSSEKVYIKLQRISCPHGPNRFSVATVEGYVSHRGKSGVRGNVVSREGTFARRAGLAGALQGLGGAVNGALGSVRIGAGGAGGAGGVFNAEKPSASDIAAASAGGGVANAASTLADYYIKRAEQYQPVIEMPTGIEVEIVFLSGFQIRGPDVHSEIAPFAAVSSAVVLALCTWAAFTCLKDGRDQTSVMVLSAGAGAAVIILAGAVLALFDRYPAFTAGSALIALAGCATGPEPCDPYRPSSSATLTRASAEVPSDALREASTRLIEPKGN